jgi:hypothetical protein
MTNVQIDNEPVTKSIASGNSVTVPTGEVWQVEITFGDDDTNISNNTYHYIDVNGTQVITIYTSSNNYNNDFNAGQFLIVEGGDTIAYTSDGGATNAHARLNGFVVSGDGTGSTDVENGVVNEVLTEGQSVTVPTGEVWKFGYTFADGDADPSNNSIFRISIDGNPILTASKTSNAYHSNQDFTDSDIVAQGGETIEFSTDNGTTSPAVKLSGWVVST